MHVRDISHPETEEQAEDVHAILESLGITDTTPQIEVWNKIDRLDPEARARIENLAARRDDVYVLSAVTGEGMEALIEAVAEKLAGSMREENLTLGFAEGRKRAWLFEKGLVEEERQDEDGYHLRVRWNAKQAAQFESL